MLILMLSTMNYLRKKRLSIFEGFLKQSNAQFIT